MTEQVLARLLDEDRTTDPVTFDGLTNHRPMALVALVSLGADGERLSAFATAYGTRLVPCRASVSATTARFLGDLDRLGLESVLDAAMTKLADGVGGAAFHGLIRLGYGIEHGRHADIAAGLAYLEDTAQPIERSGAHTGSTGDLATVLGEIRDDPRLRGRGFTGSGFSAKFSEVAVDAVFLEHLDRLSGPALSPAQVAAVALALYCSTGDFFALHTLTATHAARLVAETLDSEVEALLFSGLARAVAAAYVVIGTPVIASSAFVGTPPGWADIERAALRSDDPHVLKMVHSCRAEQAVWGDVAYQWTAAGVAKIDHT